MTTPPISGVTICTGPQDWQILQRNEAGVGTLKLTGTSHCVVADHSIQVRVVRENDGAPVDEALNWSSVQSVGDGDWEVHIERVPSGGLYRIETRIWISGDRPLRGDCIHHLGVGDIWVIAGQSNASGTGLGPVDDPPVFGVHQLGNDEKWKIAVHPIEDATRTLHPITANGIFHGHSAWLAFGKFLQRELGYPIGLIPTALAGSAIALWQPGAALFGNLIEMMNIAGGLVRGVVWYQGESDAMASATVETYEQSFRTMVTELRRATGMPHLPILTAQLSRYASPPPESPAHRNWSRMRELQRKLAAELLGTHLVPTVDLALGDDIHLTALAEVELGRRFAVSALKTLNRSSMDSPGIELTQIVLVSADPQRIILKFNSVKAGWVTIGECRDFSVEDQAGEIAIRKLLLNDNGTIEIELVRPPQLPATVTAHFGCFPTASLRDRDQRPVIAFSQTA